LKPIAERESWEARLKKKMPRGPGKKKNYRGATNHKITQPKQDWKHNQPRMRGKVRVLVKRTPGRTIGGMSKKTSNKDHAKKLGKKNKKNLSQSRERN